MHGRTISLLPFDSKQLRRNKERVRSSRCLHYLSIYAREWLISNLRNNRWVHFTSATADLRKYDFSIWLSNVIFLIIRPVIGPVALKHLCCWAGHHLPGAWPPGWRGYKQTVCKTTLRIRAGWLSSEVPPGDGEVAQLREGHLGARRCFTKDIPTSLEPPTSTCVFSFIHPALPLPPPCWSPPRSSPDCLSARPARPTPSRSSAATAVVTRFSQESQQNAGLEELHRPPPGAPDAASLQPVLSWTSPAPAAPATVT